MSQDLIARLPRTLGIDRAGLSRSIIKSSANSFDRQGKGNTMKSDNSSAISRLGEEIVRVVSSNKHLSATEKTIAICQAFGDIIGTIDCEICREIIDADRDSFLLDDLIAAVDEGHHPPE